MNGTSQLLGLAFILTHFHAGGFETRPYMRIAPGVLFSRLIRR